MAAEEESTESPPNEEGEVERDLTIDELRAIAENPNFNLGSVLLNPRVPDSSSNMFPSHMSFSFDSLFRSDDRDIDTDRKIPPPPVPLPTATVDDFAGYFEEVSQPYARFTRNHRKSVEGEDEFVTMERVYSPQEVYQEVPTLFQREDFTLDEPEIFRKVVADAPVDRQAQLTHYLDIVEICLLRQISSRQDAFFHALSNLQELQTDVTHACTSVHTMRGGTQALQKDMVSGSMKVPQLARRKENMTALLKQLELVQKVYDAYEAVQAQFNAADFAGALGLIHQAQALIKEQVPNIVCLQAIARQLADYELSSAKFLASQFVNICIAADTISFDASSMPLQPDSSFQLQILNQEESQRLVFLTRSLVRIGEMPTALDKYKRRMEENIKLVVTISVQEYVRDEKETPAESDPKLGAKLCALDATSFHSCLQSAFDSILEALHRAQDVHLVLSTTLKEPQDKPESPSSPSSAAEDSPQPTNGIKLPSSQPTQITPYDPLTMKDFEATQRPTQLIDESQKILLESAELAQKSVVKLLVLRKDVHTKLEMDVLKELWTITFEFLQAVEKVSGRSCYGLRSTLLAQAKAYLEYQFVGYQTSLAAALDSEKWTQCDVSPERQAALDRLSSGQAFLPGSFSSNLGSQPKRSKGSKRELNDAVVEGSRFKVVWSLLLLVEMVSAFLATAANFPMLATDALRKIAELLGLFNTRATQLVLMAGALHSSARLSTITAKHLAVTSHCLSLVMALLPHIRAALSAQLPPKHHLLLGEFDRVKQNYIEHHEMILSKFVSIVSEIVDSLAKTIPTTDWDSGSASGDSSSNFISETIKNTTAMHKVLFFTTQLPPEQVQEIFSRIFESFNQKIPEYFAEVSPKTPAGQQRLVDEIQYLCHSMERLRGVSAANLDLETHFRERFPDAR